MKTFRASKGPFSEQPFYELSEVESMCLDELIRTDLYPSSPQPIRIDRFIEKRFGITHEYEELPASVLGFTIFGDRGVESIVIARFLEDDGTAVGQRRVRATLAHEAGHVLLHGHLFALGGRGYSLFGDNHASDKPKVLCRDISDGTHSPQRGYDGRWWEYQANMAIGAFLLPRPLMEQSLEPLLTTRGIIGGKVLEESRREEASYTVAEVFDVNPAVARIRINELYSVTEERQLSL